MEHPIRILHLLHTINGFGGISTICYHLNEGIQMALTSKNMAQFLHNVADKKNSQIADCAACVATPFAGLGRMLNQDF